MIRGHRAVAVTRIREFLRCVVPLVFVVAHCLVFVFSSALRVIVVFGIPSVDRVHR